MGLFKSTSFSIIYTPKDLSQWFLPTPDYDNALAAEQSLSQSWLRGRATPGYTQTVLEFGYVDFNHPDRAINIELFNPNGAIGFGSTSDDNIVGSRGNDVIFGLGGKDFLHGEAGNDTVGGGDGNDRVFGGSGDDTVYGDNGGWSEFMDSSTDGNDYLNGGSGNDTLLGGGGKDTLIGGSGVDTASYVYASSSIDASILRGNSFDAFHTTDDTFESIENLIGSKFGDQLEGDASNNTIHGGDGYDLILGGAGNDTLFADDGGGILVGGSGDDILYSGTDQNYLRGDEGNDTFNITSGDCFVFGGKGFDTVEVIGSADNWLLTYIGTEFKPGDGEYQSHYSLTDLSGSLAQPISMWGVENLRFSDGDSVVI